MKSLHLLLIASLLVCLIALSFPSSSSEVYSQEIEPFAHLVNEDEHIIRIFPDGSFWAEKNTSLRLNDFDPRTCIHPRGLNKTGKKEYDFRSLDGISGTTCYMDRFIEEARCPVCGKMVSIYEAWKSHPHDFGWLGTGKVCKKCGYDRK